MHVSVELMYICKLLAHLTYIDVRVLHVWQLRTDLQSNQEFIKPTHCTPLISVAEGGHHSPDTSR